MRTELSFRDYIYPSKALNPPYLSLVLHSLNVLLMGKAMYALHPHWLWLPEGGARIKRLITELDSSFSVPAEFSLSVSFLGSGVSGQPCP